MMMPELEESVSEHEGVPSKADDKKSKEAAGTWIKELALAEKELRKFWERGRKVVKKYLDDEEDNAATGNKVDKANFFWANVGVLKASLYANPPKPLVKREWDDFMDDTARVGSIMMERLLQQDFEKPESDMNVAFRQCVEDRLIPGLGQVWLSYDPDIETNEVEPAITKKGRTIKEAITSEKIVNEYVPMDYVFWEDFWWSPARTWQEVRWVARRVYMTKGEFGQRFGKALISKVSWTKKPQNRIGEKITPTELGVDKTEVFEIWHKPTREVHWISRSYAEGELDSCGDPLELENFFPCPKPCLATHSTANLIPKADYLMVQTQYRRIDNLSRRIGMLEDVIQASGVYDKQNKELGQILSGNSNKMIPVENWAMFGEKGGMKGAVDWFPLDMVVAALDKLRELKIDAKAELFELTGLSDIMRGATNARETLGAQEMKSQYSSVRLQFLQGEIAEFIQQALRIKAEIITKHFQIETIIKNSLIEMTPDADHAVDAAQLIKDEWQSCYRIQVFADTLAIPDYNAERAGRVEFITAMGQFISQTVPLVQMDPGSAPFLMQILQWGVASFRSAASIEGVFNKAVSAMIEKSKQPPPPPPPDPAMVKAEAEMKVKQAGVQIDAQAAAAEDQRKNAQTATEISLSVAKGQAELASKRMKTQHEIEASRAKTAAQIANIVAKKNAQAKGK